VSLLNKRIQISKLLLTPNFWAVVYSIAFYVCADQQVQEGSRPSGSVDLLISAEVIRADESCWVSSPTEADSWQFFSSGCMKYFRLYFGARDSLSVKKQNRQNSQRLTEIITIRSIITSQIQQNRFREKTRSVSTFSRLRVFLFLEEGEAGMCRSTCEGIAVILYINTFRHTHRERVTRGFQACILRMKG